MKCCQIRYVNLTYIVVGLWLIMSKNKREVYDQLGEEGLKGGGAPPGGGFGGFPGGSSGGPGFSFHAQDPNDIFK